MRVIVFFDLPTITSADRRSYRKFHKFLIDSGFIMVQESVYAKLVLNATVANSVKEKVRKESPADGLVQMLVITEKQFSNMEYITGEKTTNIIDDERRFVSI